MRGRSWRRFKKEVVVKKRLKKFLYSYWWSFMNINHSYGEPTIIDFIGKIEYFHSKTLTTDKYRSKSKVKYSLNRNKDYWRDHKVKTREYQRKVFRDILKEDGII